MISRANAAVLALAPLPLPAARAENPVSGTRFAGLARASPLGCNAEGNLCLVNAIYPMHEPKPGQSVKVGE